MSTEYGIPVGLFLWLLSVLCGSMEKLSWNICYIQICMQDRFYVSSESDQSKAVHMTEMPF